MGIATAFLVLISVDRQQVVGNKYVFFVFFSTIFAYHFILTIAVNNKSDLINLVRKQSLLYRLITFISVLGIFYFGLKLGVTKLLIIVIPSVITFFYAIPLLKYKGQWVSLRNIPRLKNISIAFSWAVMTVLFPLQEQLSSLDVWLIFVQRFFLILALIIPFDIRDIDDDKTSLQTLPQTLGISKAKQIGFLYLFLFFFIGFFKTNNNLSSIMNDFLLLIIVFFLIVKSTKNQPKYYSSFWVESIPIIWWGILVFTGG